jgi:hypothetical protein
VNCQKLKRFEKEIKKTYYNSASFEKKALQKDVYALRRAKAQLQSIIKYGLKQAYIKSGYQKANSKY